jgi:hypothetical protein
MGDNTKNSTTWRQIFKGMMNSAISNEEAYEFPIWWGRARPFESTLVKTERFQNVPVVSNFLTVVNRKFVFDKRVRNINPNKVYPNQTKFSGVNLVMDFGMAGDMKIKFGGLMETSAPTILTVS